ncbi:MAG: nucleotidyl transferase AbiEii/AbiGii toxin family protein [Alloalcanivorax venustensis]|uniref:nucleotidyl transferase AbiEii/AbiGii toxin family protein n=1 Tax=Alloalcanivorax venustensis TaxID=172371 RepID=UPI00300311B3
MVFKDQYLAQVRLLVRVLPCVAPEPCFALKGGTAINLFIRDLPRLSVDIDLTYLPIHDRKQSLKEIQRALHRIAETIKSTIPGSQVLEHAPPTQKTITRLLITDPDQSTIKIEVTPVLRGAIHPPVILPVSASVEDRFGFAETQLLAEPDLYAGKIVAALDRQHPRDLFDVQMLLEQNGIDDELRAAFIVYLISHNHSPHSLLCPNNQDITQSFEHSFSGMADKDITLEKLLRTRENLIDDIRNKMPLTHKQFLVSFYLRDPDWSLLGLEGIENLPAVRWREMNLDKAGKDTREALVEKLKKCIRYP